MIKRRSKTAPVSRLCENLGKSMGWTGWRQYHWWKWPWIVESMTVYICCLHIFRAVYYCICLLICSMGCHKLKWLRLWLATGPNFTRKWSKHCYMPRSSRNAMLMPTVMTLIMQSVKLQSCSRRDCADSSQLNHVRTLVGLLKSVCKWVQPRKLCTIAFMVSIGLCQCTMACCMQST